MQKPITTKKHVTSYTDQEWPIEFGTRLKKILVEFEKIYFDMTYYKDVNIANEYYYYFQDLGLYPVTAVTSSILQYEVLFKDRKFYEKRFLSVKLIKKLKFLHGAFEFYRSNYDPDFENPVDITIKKLRLEKRLIASKKFY